MSALDAKHPLQRRYYRRMRNAMIGATAIHAMAFIYAPAYDPQFASMKAEPLRLVQTVIEGTGSAPVLREGAPVAGPEVFAGGTRVGDAVPSPLVESAAGHLAAPGTGRGGEFAAGAGGAADDLGPEVFYAYDTAPQTLRTVNPDYPEAVKQAGAQGTVVVNVNIDPSGRILRAWVAEANAPEALLDAALDAIYQFEFSPGKQNGIPVKCTVAVPFVFSLKQTFELTETK